MEGWIADFVSAGTEKLRACPRDIQTQYEAKLKDAHAKIGELYLAVEVLKETNRYFGKRLPDGIS